MTGTWIGQALSVLMGFFAIMNPVANTPVFPGLTAQDDPGTRRKIALRALTVSFVIVLVFSAAGVGYHMPHGGESSPVQQPKSLETELDLAITPLAMPILAGPGTIATAMNFASTGG